MHRRDTKRPTYTTQTLDKNKYAWMVSKTHERILLTVNIQDPTFGIPMDPNGSI
jgi:hypothetical protein